MVASRHSARLSARRFADESDTPPSPQPPTKRAKLEPASTSEAPQAGSSSAARLPLEVVVNVMQHLRDGGKGTLATFMTTSKQMYQLAAPLLYEHVVVTRVNADRLFMGIPRTKAPKERKRTKAEFDTDVAVVDRKFGGMLTSTEDFDAYDFPSPQAGSDVETDDESAPQMKTAKGYPNEQSQKRKLALLSAAKRVHLVQVPSMALVEDLCSLVGASEDDSDSDDERDGPESVFPNARTLRSRIGSSTPCPSGMTATLRRHTRFSNSSSGSCQRQCTAARVCRWTSERAADLTEIYMETLMAEVGSHHCCTRHGRPSCFSGALPAKLTSLTVHGMRYPGERHHVDLSGMIPRASAGYGLPLGPPTDVPRTYRYFYDNSPILNGDSDECCMRHDTVEARAKAVAGNLELTAPTRADAVEVFEHVNVGSNVYTALNGALISEVEAEAAVRARVKEMIADNPDGYRFKSEAYTGWGVPKIGTGYASEDRDEDKDAAAKAAADEAARIYKDVSATSTEARRLQRDVELARTEVKRFERAKPQRVEPKRVQPQRATVTSPELEAAHQVVRDLGQAWSHVQTEMDRAKAAFEAARGTAGEAAAAAALQAKKSEELRMREKRRDADRTYGRIRTALFQSPAVMAQMAAAKQAEAAQRGATEKAEAAATGITPEQAEVAAKKAAAERALAEAKKAAAAAKDAEAAARAMYSEASDRANRLRKRADKFADERRVAKLKEGAPLPGARLKYLRSDEADPCVVCGLGHVDGWDWSLASVIQRAFDAEVQY